MNVLEGNSKVCTGTAPVLSMCYGECQVGRRGAPIRQASSDVGRGGGDEPALVSEPLLGDSRVPRRCTDVLYLDFPAYGCHGYGRRVLDGAVMRRRNVVFEAQ